MKQFAILATVLGSSLLADNLITDATTQTPITQESNQTSVNDVNSLATKTPITEPEASTKITQSPHHYQVGMDVFWQHLSAKQHFEANNAQGTMHFNSNSSFVGPRIEYEYIQPGSCYVAFQGMLADGSTSVSVNARHPDEPHKRTYKEKHISSTFANLETRLGNVFEHGPIIVILNGGLGWNYFKFNEQDKPYDNWLYVLGGLRTNYRVSNFFEVDLYADATYSFYGKSLVSHKKWQKMDHFWGYEVALPITFHTGKNKMFNIKLEPYYQQFNVKQDVFHLGSRLEFGLMF